MEQNYFLLGTLVTPLVGAILALVFAHSNRMQRIIGVLAGLIAWVFCAALLVQVHSSGVQTYALGNWQPALRHRPGSRCLGRPLRLHGHHAS